MIFGTTSLYVRIHADSVRVRPPLPAVEYPVRRCIWRFAGLFLLANTLLYSLFATIPLPSFTA
jgi:hypothetical protein